MDTSSLETAALVFGTSIDALSGDLVCLLIDPLSAEDVARASCVSRAWHAVFSSDRVWDVMWQRESWMSLVSDATGDPRKAVAQLRSSIRLSCKAPFKNLFPRLEDYTFVLDICWHGKHIFGARHALAPASLVRTDLGESCCTEMRFDNLLCSSSQWSTFWEIDESYETVLSLGGMYDSHTFALFNSRMATAAAPLTLHLLVLRSDGAIACMHANAPCTTLYDDYGRNRDEVHDRSSLLPTWRRGCLLTKRFLHRDVAKADINEALHSIRLAFYLTTIEDGNSDDEAEEASDEDDTGPFPYVTLALKDDCFEVSPSLLVHALASQLNWVLPG